MDLDDPRFRSRNVVGNWFEDIAHVRDQERMRKKLERKRRKKMGIKRNPLMIIWEPIWSMIKLLIFLALAWFTIMFIFPIIFA